MMRSNTLTWIALLLMTTCSYVVADRQGGGFVWLILALAGIKFCTVAWRFMELKQAALIWAVPLVVVLCLTLGMALWLH